MELETGKGRPGISYLKLIGSTVVGKNEKGKRIECFLDLEQKTNAFFMF